MDCVMCSIVIALIVVYFTRIHNGSLSRRAGVWMAANGDVAVADDRGHRRRVGSAGHAAESPVVLSSGVPAPRFRMPYNDGRTTVTSKRILSFGAVTIWFRFGDTIRRRSARVYKSPQRLPVGGISAAAALVAGMRRYGARRPWKCAC